MIIWIKKIAAVTLGSIFALSAVTFSDFVACIFR